MDSKTYWQQREAEALKHYIREEAEYDRQIAGIYRNMLDSIQEQIDSFYGKYAAKEGITLAEAKRRVSKLDVAAYERKAKRYVKDKDFSDKANEEMRLYNLTMKVNRLELLKANIGLELISGHDELEKFLGQILEGRTLDELRRQAGILGRTVRNNAAKAQAIVNASFHNAKFSDRIWMYQDLLKADISKLLQVGLIQGKNGRELARELRKTFDTGIYNTERLMRTELARVQTEAQRQSFLRNGFTRYKFICNHHGSTCDICKSLDGDVFEVADMMPGENAPPMHPHCRCSCAAWEDREEYDQWIDFLSQGGTTAEWEKRKKAVENSRDGGTIIENSNAIRMFQNENLLQRHFMKHVGEFPITSVDEYLSLANELADAEVSDDVVHITRADGSVSIYRFSTNEFMVINSDSTIRTFFKPKAGKEYWQYEIERNE